MPKTTFCDGVDYSDLGSSRSNTGPNDVHHTSNIDDNKQTPRYCPPQPQIKSKRGACLEEGGEDCASQAEAENGLDNTRSGTGNGCCGCASRALKSPSSCSRSRCSSLCDGSGAGRGCLDSSSGNGRV